MGLPRCPVAKMGFAEDAYSSPGETPKPSSCYFEILHQKAISECVFSSGLLEGQVYVIVFIFGTAGQRVRASLEQRASGRWMSGSRSGAYSHGQHCTSR